MVCWDIGANIGYYTCLLAHAVGATGRVVAFEPARATRERLEHNVRLNQLGHVEVLPFAVGQVEGVARIHYREAGLFEGTASLNELQGRAGSFSPLGHGARWSMAPIWPSAPAPGAAGGVVRPRRRRLASRRSGTPRAGQRQSQDEVRALAQGGLEHEGPGVLLGDASRGG